MFRALIQKSWMLAMAGWIAAAGCSGDLNANRVESAEPGPGVVVDGARASSAGEVTGSDAGTAGHDGSEAAERAGPPDGRGHERVVVPPHAGENHEAGAHDRSDAAAGSRESHEDMDLDTQVRLLEDAHAAAGERVRRPMGYDIGHSPLVASPGYYPPDDAEAASMSTGRREVGPTSAEFDGGENSAEALAWAILDALEDGDRARLSELRITREEFDTILWPEFPQSRPVTNIESGDAWFFLDADSKSGINAALDAWGGRRLFLEGISGSIGRAEYTNFALDRGVCLHARDETGSPVELRFVAAFAERNGIWKVYMYQD